LIYLEDYDAEEISAKLDNVYDNLNFSYKEAEFGEIANILRYTN